MGERKAEGGWPSLFSSSPIHHLLQGVWSFIQEGGLDRAWNRILKWLQARVRSGNRSNNLLSAFSPAEHWNRVADSRGRFSSRLSDKNRGRDCAAGMALTRSASCFGCCLADPVGATPARILAIIGDQQAPLRRRAGGQRPFPGSRRSPRPIPRLDGWAGHVLRRHQTSGCRHAWILGGTPFPPGGSGRMLP